MHKKMVAVLPHHCGLFFLLKHTTSRRRIPVTLPNVVLARRFCLRYKQIVFGDTPRSLAASVLVNRTSGIFLLHSSVSSLIADNSSGVKATLFMLFPCYCYDSLLVVKVDRDGSPFRPLLAELGCADAKGHEVSRVLHGDHFRDVQRHGVKCEFPLSLLE